MPQVTDKLISKSDIALYKSISQGVSEARVNQFILEAQFNDLKPLMCDEFYFDMIANKTEDNYKKLIEGGTYEVSDVTYRFEGIRAVLAYFTWARYSMKGDVQDTPFQQVTKVNEFSQPVSSTVKRDNREDDRRIAFSHWADCLKYIRANTALFPVWEKCGSCSDTRQTNRSFRHSTI